MNYDEILKSALQIIGKCNTTAKAVRLLECMSHAPNSWDGGATSAQIAEQLRKVPRYRFNLNPENKLEYDWYVDLYFGGSVSETLDLHVRCWDTLDDFRQQWTREGYDARWIYCDDVLVQIILDGVEYTGYQVGPNR